MLRFWIRSNKLLVAAVKLETVCGYSSIGMPALARRCDARLHLVGIVPELARSTNLCAPIEQRALDGMLEVDRITRRGGKNAVLHQAYHLRFLVKGDSDERGAVTLGRRVDPDVDRNPFQGGRERRLHAAVPCAHVDELRFR